VPYLLFHVGRALTVLEQPRRESVSKIVEADTSNARLDERGWNTRSQRCRFANDCIAPETNKVSSAPDSLTDHTDGG
jgi:hypothetical protein